MTDDPDYTLTQPLTCPRKWDHLTRLYQYTAIDDCSRYQVIGVFLRKTAASTLTFLEQVVEETPFPIQRIQTDRGQEVFAYRVQDRLREWSIKVRPIRPRAPHLNLNGRKGAAKRSRRVLAHCRSGGSGARRQARGVAAFLQRGPPSRQPRRPAAD